jgi:hypothetical protein
LLAYLSSVLLSFSLLSSFPKKRSWGVPVRISECCFALLFLQDVCGPIDGNGDTASIVTDREDTVAGLAKASSCSFVKTAFVPSFGPSVLPLEIRSFNVLMEYWRISIQI